MDNLSMKNRVFGRMIKFLILRITNKICGAIQI